MKTAKLIGILVLVLALGIVIIQNRAPVRTHFLFITVEMPHILLLLITSGAGFALGLLVALFNRSKTQGVRENIASMLNKIHICPIVFARLDRAIQRMDMQ
jgi:uncharacterized integral membrane protein